MNTATIAAAALTEHLPSLAAAPPANISLEGAITTNMHLLDGTYELLDAAYLRATVATATLKIAQDTETNRRNEIAATNDAKALGATVDAQKAKISHMIVTEGIAAQVGAAEVEFSAASAEVKRLESLRDRYRAALRGYEAILGITHRAG